MKGKIFADSGAYSAWANKTEVDLQEYIDFIKENIDAIETYACLDDIESPDKTWENQREMEKQGLKPLPVWHVVEPDKYLEMAMEYDYFAVGGMSLKSSVARKNRFDYVFSKVCTKKTNFYPSHKIHGFGLSSPDLLIAYPWYSVDSTSWVQYGRYGIVLVPRVKNGTLRYDLPPYSMAISSRSKAVGDVKHFRNFSPMEQHWITSYCKEKGFEIGKTLYKQVSPGYVLKDNESWFDRENKQRVEVVIKPGLCCDGEMRDAFNLLYFLDLERNQPEWPWRWTSKKVSIFD